MYIPRDLIMMGLGSILTFVVAYICTINHPEEEPKEEPKKKKDNWIKKGWRNAKRDWKKRFKKKEGENTYRKKIERLHKTIEGLVE